MPAPPPLVEIRNLTRHQDGIVALDNLNLAIQPGEIIGLLGSSGAGKSAVLEALAGLRPGKSRPPAQRADRSQALPTSHGIASRDCGTILWQGVDVTTHGPREAAARGIEFLPQHPALPDAFSVAAAMALGREPVRGIFLDHGEMNRRARTGLARLGLSIDPNTRLGELTARERQLVAIARVLAADSRLLLLDAATAPLRPPDTDPIFEILGDLQARGTAIVYVSDRLGEINALATRALVLRDGRLIGALDRSEINPEAIHRLRAGHTLDLPLKELIEPGPTVVEVAGLRTRAHPKTIVDFAAREGEIVGLAGLAGAGRTSLLRTLAGVERPLAGTIRLHHRLIPPGQPTAALAVGAFLVDATAPDASPASTLTLHDTLTLASLTRLSVAGIVSRRAIARLAFLLNDHLSITDDSLDQPHRLLTPSQKRKTAIARHLARQPTVALFNRPTRGVTMATRVEIYECLERLAERGAAVIFASDEMDELLRLADRLLVFRHGALAGTLTRADDFTERGIMHLAAGLTR